MAHAVAASTGAQWDGTNTVLTYDVLVVDPSLDTGSTYIAADAAVDMTQTAEQIEASVGQQIRDDIENQTSVVLNNTELLFPARAKG